MTAQAHPSAGPSRPGQDGAPRGAGETRRVPGAGRLHSWRVAVRIARRDAWRAKGRSLMVLAMIAVPVIGVSAADVTIRSSQLTPVQTITRDIGAADARLEDAGHGPQAILQSPEGTTSVTAKQPDPHESGGVVTPAAVDPRAGAPEGSRSISDTTTLADITTKAGLLGTEVRELDAADPIAAGIMDLTGGRFPSAPTEVAATNAFLEHSGLHVGSRLKGYSLDRAYRIVGSYDLPSKLDFDQLDFRPGAFIHPYVAARRAAGADVTDPEPSYLVKSPGGSFTWGMVQKANKHGVRVHARQVMLHPPAASEVALYTSPNYYGSPQSDNRAGVTAGATIAGLALLEICLLAGPAFAVGARRSRRQLGLVGANGGDRRHIRATVLSGGLVLGAVAAVTGTAIGVVLTLLLRTTLEELTGSRFGGITLRPAELSGIAVIAVVTGLLAAIVPAVTASRQSVLSSLTGRRGTPRSRHVLPVAGLAAVGLGAVIAVYGSVRSDSTVLVAGGSGLAELGLVALTPALVGVFGRIGRILPLTPRLALRDAVRNRGRTAPAVAAVLAAVAGTVAVATYSASQHQQDQNSYSVRAPLGVVWINLPSRAGQGLEALSKRAAGHLPVAKQVDVFRLSYDKKVCDQGNMGPGCATFTAVLPKANACPADAEGAAVRFTPAQLREFADDWRCREDGTLPVITAEEDILVGGPEILQALGIHDRAADKTLTDGGTVLFNRAYDDHGTLGLQFTRDGRTIDKKLPVRLVSARSYGARAVVSKRAAASAGLKSVPIGTLFTTTRMPSAAEEQALKQDVAKQGVIAEANMERGYNSRNSAILAALMVFAGLITIGAAGVATGLAQADAESDLRTLAAVGAPTRIRRTLSGLQCGLIAAMGVVLGIAAGILPAVALRRIDRQQAEAQAQQALSQGHGGSVTHVDVPVAVPWQTLGLLLILVPLGATLLAALVTRSNSPIGRRAQA
ncbi:ABC transporter permease [Streptomyces avermitilis]|uniref:ABC transporter permease n=1 Tax=Streptomyces avermitilis TaxID=33903 RepID=UPI0033A0867E